MSHTFIIIDDNQEDVSKTQAIAERFRNLSFLASANNYDDGVNLILEHQPHLVFLEIDPADKNSNLSLSLINELYRYLKHVPKIIVTTSKKDLAYDALQYEVVDYLLKPLNINDFRKAILKFDRAIHSDLPHMEVKNPVATYEVLDETEVVALNEEEVDENVNDIEVKSTTVIPEKPTVVVNQDQSPCTLR
eukprot:Opistho-1_new@82062